MAGEKPPNPASPPSTRGGPPASVRRPSGLRGMVDFGLMTPAARVIEEILALEPGERLVVLHDRANAEIGSALEHAARDHKAEALRVDLDLLATRPFLVCPPEVIERIRDADASVLAMTNEEGEYGARRDIVRAAAAARVRHVHMIGVSHRSFTASLMASPSRVSELIDALRRAIKPTSKLTVLSASGTRLEIAMAPHLRWFVNGNAVKRGEWINVPTGALVSSPGRIDGTYVADAAMGGPLGARTGLLGARPVRLEIEGGKVRRVECTDKAIQHHVEQFMATGSAHDRVGLLNIGANIGIISPLGEILHDETMPGVHIALGDNFASQTGATWSSQGQLSFAMASADVDLDGAPLIRRGRYVRLV